jgi:hypothetical protein
MALALHVYEVFIPTCLLTDYILKEQQNNVNFTGRAAGHKYCSACLSSFPRRDQSGA